ncbi:DUF5060 domain-containing protein [Zobellia laminariae]|uniref:DUF5060 domain-containing protein n=1 Tax=Zobellia laminariae TaxID=248906 RepID=UPI0026F4766B|nr:DUF5060 domain-containing protein [Zobellia laminariae]WKX75160.1 DUF5060 domain-containing protein [Zobellia laminariae]
MKFFVLTCALVFVLGSCTKKGSTKNYLLEGNLKKWQPVTLTFNGPEVSETDSINPFLDYSLLVNFSNKDTTYTVHGYFAADGDAANSSAEAGNKWQVKFSPGRNW